MGNKINIAPLAELTTSLWKFRTLIAGIKLNVFDTAQEYVDKEGNRDNINILPGDYFKVDFPVHDVVLFSQVFHSNSPDEKSAALKESL